VGSPAHLDASVAFVAKRNIIPDPPDHPAPSAQGNQAAWSG
jgi:hypothetical protein